MANPQKAMEFGIIQDERTTPGNIGDVFYGLAEFGRLMVGRSLRSLESRERDSCCCIIV